MVAEQFIGGATSIGGWIYSGLAVCQLRCDRSIGINVYVLIMLLLSSRRRRRRRQDQVETSPQTIKSDPSSINGRRVCRVKTISGRLVLSSASTKTRSESACSFLGEKIEADVITGENES